MQKRTIETLARILAYVAPNHSARTDDIATELFDGNVPAARRALAKLVKAEILFKAQGDWDGTEYGPRRTKGQYASEVWSINYEYHVLTLDQARIVVTHEGDLDEKLTAAGIDYC